MVTIEELAVSVTTEVVYIAEIKPELQKITCDTKAGKTQKSSKTLTRRLIAISFTIHDSRGTFHFLSYELGDIVWVRRANRTISRFSLTRTGAGT